jgi:hypothetical protein
MQTPAMETPTFGGSLLEPILCLVCHPFTPHIGSLSTWFLSLLIHAATIFRFPHGPSRSSFARCGTRNTICFSNNHRGSELSSLILDAFFAILGRKSYLSVIVGSQECAAGRCR